MLIGVKDLLDWEIPDTFAKRTYRKNEVFERSLTH